MSTSNANEPEDSKKTYRVTRTWTVEAYDEEDAVMQVLHESVDPDGEPRVAELAGPEAQT